MSTRDPYRPIAGIYDRLIEPMQAGVRRVALQVVPPQSDWEVLDVGCGTGTGLARYADAGCVVAGVDVSPAMLERAAARLGERAELRITEGGPLPFEDDRFDLVATSMVLHEVPEEEREDFVAEMARVTRPGGKILVVDFRFGELRGWRGPTLRAASWVIERLSGHYTGYRTFREEGGVPSVLDRAGLAITREKIVAGGNVAIYVVSPTR